jgi:hypothetical protein
MLVKAATPVQSLNVFARVRVAALEAAPLPDGFNILGGKTQCPENTLEALCVFWIPLMRFGRSNQVVAQRGHCPACKEPSEDCFRPIELQARSAVEMLKFRVRECDQHSVGPSAWRGHEGSPLADPQRKVVHACLARIRRFRSGLAKHVRVHEEAVEEPVDPPDAHAVISFGAERRE